MNLRKILTSLNIHSPVDASANTKKRRANGGTYDPLYHGTRMASANLDMDDLLSQHLAQRSLRMFAAEEAESRRSLDRRARRLETSQTRSNVQGLNDMTGDPDHPVTSHSRGHARWGRAEEPGHERHRAHRRGSDPLARMTRRDRNVRTTALASISTTMLDYSLTPRSAAVALGKVMEECRAAGVPFGELLEEDLDFLEISPLVMELIRCDWEKGPELLLFLLEHSISKKLIWNVRKGCMIRSDNLYQTLRQLLPPQEDIQPWDPPPFEFEVSVHQQGPLSDCTITQLNAAPPNEFRALISIPNFPAALSNDVKALAKRRIIPPEKRGESGTTPLRPEAGLVVDWIACGRVWTMEIGHNHLILSLVDGEPCSVEARMVVVKEDRPALKLHIADTTSSLLQPQNGSSANHIPVVNVNPATPISTDPSKSRALPTPPVSLRPVMSTASRPARPPRPPRVFTFPSSTLHPPHSTGPHKVTVAPCFPFVSPISHPSSSGPSSSFAHTVLSSQELLVELVVKLGKPSEHDSKAAIMARRPASIGGRSMVQDVDYSDPFFDDSSSYGGHDELGSEVHLGSNSASPYFTTFNNRLMAAESIAGHSSMVHLLSTDPEDMISRSTTPQHVNPLQPLDYGPYGYFDENRAGPSKWANGLLGVDSLSPKRSTSYYL